MLISFATKLIVCARFYLNDNKLSVESINNLIMTKMQKIRILLQAADYKFGFSLEE